MKKSILLLMVLSLFLISCTAELKPEDKALLDNSLKAADSAKMACEKSAGQAQTAASSASASAAAAADSAKKAEAAAAKCVKAYEKSLKKHK